MGNVNIIELNNIYRMHERTTKAKIKRAEGANLKSSTSNKLYRSLTVQCSEMPVSF
jgi:hypothetical protein